MKEFLDILKQYREADPLLKMLMLILGFFVLLASAGIGFSLFIVYYLLFCY